MGTGVAAWFTPGFMQHEPRFTPTIAKPGYIATMIAEGEDPKPLVLEECKP